MAFLDALGAADRLALRALGEAVTYTPGVGAPVVLTGPFDAAYVVVDPSGAEQPGASSSSPAVSLRVADLPSDPSEDHDARVTVRSVVYRIHEVKPDGMGLVVLLLHEV